MWNKLKIVGRLHQIGKKMLFLFSDGLSLMISRLSLISNKYFLFSWAKIVKIKWLILERRVVQIEQ